MITDPRLFAFCSYVEDFMLCGLQVNLDNLFQVALATGERQKRGRKALRLTHPNYPGEGRGTIECELDLLPEAQALKEPVGNKREEPNDNPYLPEPERNPKTMFGKLLDGIWSKVGYTGVFAIILILAAVYFFPPK